MVDSGCERTCIRVDILGGLESQMRSWNLPPLRGAGNTEIWPEGIIALSLRYQALVVELNDVAVMADCPYGVLLGLDWLAATGAQLNFSKGGCALSFAEGGVLAGQVVPSDKSGNGNAMVEITQEEELVQGGDGTKEAEEGGQVGLAIGGCGTVDTQQGLEEEAVEQVEVNGKLKSGNTPMCCAVPGQASGHLHAVGERRNLRLLEGITLDPGESKFVDFRLTEDSGVDVVIEDKVTERWAVPHSLAKVEGGRVATLLTNLSEERLRLTGNDVRLRALKIKSDEQCVKRQAVVGKSEVAAALFGSGEEERGEELRFGNSLTPEQKEAVLALLKRHERCFRTDTLRESKAQHQQFPHHIDTGNCRPIHVPPRR